MAPESTLCCDEESFKKPLSKRLDEADRQRDLLLRYAHTPTYDSPRIVGLLNILVIDHAHLVRQKMPFLKDAADGYPQS